MSIKNARQPILHDDTDAMAGPFKASVVARMRTVSLVIVAALTAGALGGCGTSATPSVQSLAPPKKVQLPSPVSFGYTGSPQTYVVPAGVTQIIVTASGATGGYAPYSPGGGGGVSSGGLGAQVVANMFAYPAQTLVVTVGGYGQNLPNSSCGYFTACPGGVGGYNGGGAGGSTPYEGIYVTFAGGAGGGGATTVADGSQGYVLLTAGGGGGGASFGSGGNGGQPNGQPGLRGFAGGGGSQTSGGAAGPAGGGGMPGGAGDFLAGGAGANGVDYTVYYPPSFSSGGGGGGGGYYGGGGGGGDTNLNLGGAGGGGSSYANPFATFGVQYNLVGDGNAQGSVTLQLLYGPIPCNQGGAC